MLLTTNINYYRIFHRRGHIILSHRRHQQQQQLISQACIRSSLCSSKPYSSISRSRSSHVRFSRPVLLKGIPCSSSGSQISKAQQSTNFNFFYSTSTTNTAATSDTNTSNEQSDLSLAWLNGGKIYNNGPDQILPSKAIRAWDPRGAIQILPYGNDPREQPLSVPSMLTNCAQNIPNKIALRMERNGEWQTWTYKEYLADSRTVAKGFIALGLERFHSVCILGANAPEWVISVMGAIFAGGFSAGIYATSSPEACAYTAADSKANIIVVDDAEQLDKILKVRSQLPHLKAIVQYGGDADPKIPGVYNWSELMELGAQQSDACLEERLQLQAVNQCCALIYTSGTTGTPKGVMLSQDSITWLSRVITKWAYYTEATAEGTFQEEVLSFLPLSHIAAYGADIFISLSCGAMVTFADRNALRGTLVENLKTARPTKFAAVPRVWEKFAEEIGKVDQAATGVKKLLLTWAKKKGLEHNLRKMEGNENESLGFKLANKLVFTKIKQSIGLERCNLFISGAAPISMENLHYLASLNILLTEVYGMSECGPHTFSIPSIFRFGSVGKPMTGCLTKIDNPNPKDGGQGELLLGGRNILIGYLNQEAKTKETIDDERWLHTQDVARIDSDNFVHITGRLKEIIITAGGENIAPVAIEDRVKAQLPVVSQAVLIGDKLRHLSMLLTLKTEIDPITLEPLDQLTPGCREWLKQHGGGCNVSTVSEVLDALHSQHNKQLFLAIQNGIDRANAHAISHAQLIQKWVILAKDFSLPGGELGPTLKLKRSVVYEKYKDVIAKLYH